MSIQDRLDREPAPGWKPNPGDQIVGKIVEISEAPGTNWGPYPLLVIEQADGTEVSVHAFHTVLKKEISAKRPSEGDEIGIRYLGKPAGKDYESYRVVLERHTPVSATDWGAVEKQADQELAGASVPTDAGEPDWADESPF